MSSSQFLNAVTLGQVISGPVVAHVADIRSPQLVSIASKSSGSGALSPRTDLPVLASRNGR